MAAAAPGGEALRARRAVGVADLPGAVLLRAAGPDRVSFLHRILTCDVQGLAPGGTARGLLLTVKGKVVADLLLAVLPDRVEMVADPGARPALLAGLAKFSVVDDVRFEDRGDAAGLLSLVGARAGEAAAALLEEPGAGEAGAASVGGRPVLFLRGTRAGLPSVDIVAESGDLAAVREAALRAAASVGGGALSREDLDVLRVENGVPRLGAEAGEETLPQEAGLTDRVSFTKGCFLGQEPVARLQNRGHTNRGLAGVVLEEGAPVPAAGDPLLDGEREVGAVTSAVLSPSLGRPVALALLRNEVAAPGTPLRLRSGGAVLSCSVVPLPFVPGGRG